MAEELAEIVNGKVTWDKINSNIDTAKRCWLKKPHKDTTHVCVIQDDAIPCEGFLELVEKVVTVHPKKVISLFNMYAVRSSKTTPYYSFMQNVTGVCMILPIELIDDIFGGETLSDDDATVSKWLRDNNEEALTTIPVLVQHRDEKSLLSDTWARVDRQSIFFHNQGDEMDWDSTEILHLFPYLTDAQKREVESR